MQINQQNALILKQKISQTIFILSVFDQLLIHFNNPPRAPKDREASIKDSGFTRPGSGVTVLCLHCAN